MHLVLVVVADGQGILLDHLPLVARGVCVPWSHGIVAIGGTVRGRLLTIPRTLHNRLRHNPHISVKEATLVDQELQRRGRLQVGHTFSGLQSCSQGT